MAQLFTCEEFPHGVFLVVTDEPKRAAKDQPQDVNGYCRGCGEEARACICELPPVDRKGKERFG